MAENTINNPDLINDIPALAQSLSASSIGDSISLQVPPNTPPRQNGGQPYISPLTNLTPETRKIVYGMMKPGEEADTPLTKRRKVANASNSPVDMSCLDKPDVFEMLDYNHVEIPKERKSTPFLEHHKRMLGMIGDTYDGTPLRRPPGDDIEAEPKTKEPSRDGEPKTTENELQVIEVESTQKESTQVQAFRKFILRNREDNRETLPDTVEIIKRHSGTDNDHAEPEEDQPIPQTQTFDKKTTMAENTINNPDLINDIPEGIPVRNIEVNRAVAQNLRASSIGKSVSLEVPPNTPPRQSGGQSYISPLSKLVESLTPVTKKLLYDLIKSSRDTETPLTKRRRLEFVTDSLIDMSCNAKSILPHEDDIETEPKTNASSRDVCELTPVRSIDVNITPAEHPRAALIENIVRQQLPPQVPNTPPRQTVGHSSISPLTKFIEGLTPITKKRVYDLIKSSRDTDTPLTKRRKENLINSPDDMSINTKPVVRHGDDIEEEPKRNDTSGDGELN